MRFHFRRSFCYRDVGFGGADTNKTLAILRQDAQARAELLGAKNKYIAKSPYTRG